MKTLKKNNISQGSSINSPVPVNKNCDLPPFFNPDYFAHVVVQTIDELNSIPCKLRQDGLIATVVQDNYADYQLQSSRTGFGICDNQAWQKINSGDTFYDGGNLFIFQTTAEAEEYKQSTVSKQGHIVYIVEQDAYFMYDGQDNFVDPFPHKLNTPTQDGVDGPEYKVPAYLLDGSAYWRSATDFGKVDTVNAKIPDENRNVTLKISDLEDDKGLALLSDLDNEINNRIDSYNELQQSINTETSNRITQINNIEQKIQTEKSERISEDDILNYKIDTTKTELNTNFDAKLSQESTLRQNQDAVLDNKITTEKTDRINADNLKLDKPTTTGSTISHPNVVGVDSQGNSAKLPAGDLGKNFANTDLVVTTNRKHIGTASVELGMPFICSNASVRFSGLLDKSADAAYNQLLGVDSNGNVAKLNGKTAFNNLPNLLSEEEKTIWKTAMNGGWSTATMSVSSISPVILSNLYDGISYMVLYGANLNLNPTNFQITIISQDGLTIIKEIPGSQVQLNTQGTSLTFYMNFSQIAKGTYKIRLRNGIAEYVTPMTFIVSDQIVDTINTSAITWGVIGKNGKVHPDNISSGGSLVYKHSNDLPFINENNVIWGTKSSKLAESNENFYLRLEIARTFYSTEGAKSSRTFFHIGLMSTNESLELINKTTVGIRISDPASYPSGGHYIGILGGTDEVINGTISFSRTIHIIKRGNMITTINGSNQGVVTTEFLGGVSLACFAENKINASEFQSVVIAEAYKF